MLWGYVNIIVPNDGATLCFGAKEKSRASKLRIDFLFQKRTSIVYFFCSISKG